MSISMKSVICQFGVLLALFAQEPAPADPVIRVSVDLVQLDAVVRDSSGRHVRDLRAEEFEILEDGKPQKITHFSFVFGGAAGGKRVAPVAAGGASAAAMLTPDEVHRTVVLLADDLGISAESMPRVKKALANVVDQHLLPDDLVSLMAASGGTGAMQQFTSNRQQLHAAIDRIHWFRGISPFKPILGVDSAIAAKTTRYLKANEGMAGLVDQHFRYGTLAAVHYAIQGMRQMPGRKALVLLTEGVGLDTLLEGVIDEANRAGVAIYPVDVRGVVFTGMTASDGVLARNGQGRINPTLSIDSATRSRVNVFENSRRGMSRLAVETGGVFLEGDNDIGALLANAVEEVGDYYLIGYQPQRDDYGTKFHRVQIRVKRRGLHATTRSGFLGTPGTEGPEPPKAREMQLAAALMSPFRGAIPTPLTILYGPGQKNPKTGKREVVLRGQVVLDAKALEFVQQPNGRHRAVVDAVVAAYGSDGKVAASQDRTFTVDLDAAELQTTLAEGLFYGAVLTLPKPGAYQFRIALRDAGTGKTGSANRFVEVPDFDSPKLTLASIVLADNVTHQYRAGAPIAFRSDAFGAAGSVLRFEVHLYRGPERIYAGPLLNMQAQDVAKQMSVSGQLRLPDTLPAGDYAMELVVRDEARVATQWTEFSLTAK